MANRLDDDSATDESFGGYQFVKRLAVGGMAEIFLAVEEGGGPDDLIVVKRLLPHISSHPGLVQMFLDEGRIATTLEHPNIVQIYNVGSIGNRYFLSLEYLRGLDVMRMCRTLAARRQVLPPNIVIYIASCAANALHYAHTKRGTAGKLLGIVHRDVSPHNIFVTQSGDVKLLDFGVAKAANALHHTKTGALVGKIAYMSPEQCRTSDIDGRSDQFSLGIVMYEMSTGRRLYNTKKLGEFEVLRRICDQPPTPPSELRPGYPPPLQRIVLKLLEKDPADRYPDAGELVRDLADAATSLGYDLSRESMARFLASELSEALAETTSVPKVLPRGSGAMGAGSGAGRRRAAPDTGGTYDSGSLVTGHSGGYGHGERSRRDSGHGDSGNGDSDHSGSGLSGSGHSGSGLSGSGSFGGRGSPAPKEYLSGVYDGSASRPRFGASADLPRIRPPRRKRRTSSHHSGGDWVTSGSSGSSSIAAGELIVNDFASRDDDKTDPMSLRRRPPRSDFGLRPQRGGRGSKRSKLSRPPPPVRPPTEEWFANASSWVLPVALVLEGAVVVVLVVVLIWLL